MTNTYVMELLYGISGYLLGGFLGMWLFPRKPDINVHIDVDGTMDKDAIVTAVRAAFAQARELE